ncbi:MAG: MBL fold metallo-hydrolase [Planctomycetes bacterium]|nr:MBL fold metallo-hydrolase [Phycisphaerae bacterium]NBB95832.1 MBL fold metallo-hydrolase [Planctomycetota bacterium]
MSVEWSIISIGAMACNLLWQETRPVRTQHATTTLVTHGQRRILVDPSLPAEILAARLGERTGLKPEQITDVFCTTLHPSARRGLDAFGNARHWAGETEIESYARRLEALSESADRLDTDDAANVRAEIETIRRFEAAPETFSEMVDIFPLAGATPGCTGLLLTPPTRTLLVAGPAVATAGYLTAGMVWQDATDTKAAMASLRDVLEVAEIIVPGFDNVTFVPGRWM